MYRHGDRCTQGPVGVVGCDGRLDGELARVEVVAFDVWRDKRCTGWFERLEAGRRIMLNRILLAACVLVPFAGGCGSKFAGEWVQESAMSRTGTLTPVAGNRRLAMQ